MSTFSLLLKGSGLRTLESVVSIVLGLLTLPLMMRFLGVDLYGVWVLIGSFTALLYIFDLGFASAVTRHMADAIGQKNSHRMNQIINNALLVYIGLALLILLVVTVLSLTLKPNLNGVLTQEAFAQILWLFGAALAIEFPVKAFSGVATGYLRYDLLSIYRIIIRIITVSILVALLFSGFQLVAIAALNAVMGIISAVAYVWVAKYLFKDFALSKRYFSLAVVKEIYRYSLWAFLVDMNQLIKSRMDIFVVGAQLTLGAVSIYYVAVRLVEYVSELLYKMLNLATPLLTQHNAKDDERAFREDLLLFTRINVYFSLLVFIGWIIVGELIIYLWMGSDFDFRLAYQVLLILLLGRLAGVMVNGLTSALYAKSIHKYLAQITLFETLLSGGLFALLWFAKSIGMIDEINLLTIAWAMTLPLLIGRGLLIPWITLLKAKITQPLDFLRLSIRPFCLSPLAVAWWLGLHHESVDITVHLPWLVLAALLSLLLVVLVLRWELLPREKLLVVRFLRKSKIFIAN